MGKFTIKREGRTPFPHYWEMCVGSCHAYTALREDYRKQLRRAHGELGFRYVRFHGLLDDDMCVCVMNRDYQGNELGLIYNFVNIDNIIDFLLETGMKPFLELGFMPEALASGDRTCFHYKGNITPPKDYDAWGDLIGRLTAHLVERYGKEEVRQWYFEVWNEPNLPYFFSGTRDEYFKMYDYAVRAIKKVDAELAVGGPATSCNMWITDMIDHCEKNGIPLDFLSTHHYPTDDPLWRNSDMSVEELFKKLGEDMMKYERGIIQKMTARARKEAGDYPLIYTEWNTSAMTRDDRHDECYAASMIAKILADNDGLVEGYSYWTFTDIFEEGSQIPGVFHGGFGLQTYAGIAKPAYRLFELFHRLGISRLPVEVSGGPSNVELLATETESGYALIAYNHNVPGEPMAREEIDIDLEELSEGKIRLFRIDGNHVNPKAAWMGMGSPEYPNKDQLQELHRASELKGEEFAAAGKLKLSVPEYGVVFIEILCP